MQKELVKKQINKLIDVLPEVVVNDLIKYLNSRKKEYEKQGINLAEYLDKVLTEDNELLTLLAQ